MTRWEPDGRFRLVILTRTYEMLMRKTSGRFEPKIILVSKFNTTEFTVPHFTIPRKL